MVGASMWQGWHQSAHESSSTGLSARSTTSWKLASVTVTGPAGGGPPARAPAAGSDVLHLPQRAGSPARASGIRLIAPHAGHRSSMASVYRREPARLLPALRPPAARADAAARGAGSGARGG